MLMPHRIVNNIKYHLMYSVMLLVILFGFLPLMMTISSVILRGNVVLNILAVWILVGFYYAFPEKVRLDRNAGEMREFRKATPDGTYDAKADLRAFFRSDEYKSDVVAILLNVVVVVAIVAVAIMFRWINPPRVLQALAYHPASLLLIIPITLMLTVSYAAFHLFFTVLVHKGWDETRLHVANERHMEQSDSRKK